MEVVSVWRLDGVADGEHGVRYDWSEEGGKEIWRWFGALR